MRSGEDAAARLVEQLLGVRAVEHDVPGAAPAGSYDFDLVSTDDNFGALEVTSFHFQEYRDLVGALESKGPLTGTGLMHGWRVTLGSAALGSRQIRDLRAAIVPILARFERAGRTSVRLDDNPNPARPFGALPIDYANVDPTVPTGQVVFEAFGVAIAPNIYDAHLPIERELSAKSMTSSAEKLTRAKTNGPRILFIWVDYRNFGVAGGMLASIDHPMPDLRPSIPAGATEVWAALGETWEDSDRILWRSSGGSWVAEAVPPSPRA